MNHFTSKKGREELIELINNLTQNNNILKIFKLGDVKLPQRIGRNAGFDFFIPNNFKDYILKKGDHIKIPSKIKVKIPNGYTLIAFNKSGISTKYGLQVGACVIDENYTGEIGLHVMNFGPKDVELIPGMKIVQFILLKTNYAVPIEYYDENDLYDDIDYMERGDGGFGSTGI